MAWLRRGLFHLAFQHSHSGEVNEQYFICCHVLPLRRDYIYLCPSLFDKLCGTTCIYEGLEPRTLYPWLMVRVKTTVRSVLFIFSSTLVLRCISLDGRQRSGINLSCREKVAPLCRQRPPCQRFTTLPWPQLLSGWQTVWQSQVVGNLSWRPLKQMAPGLPSLQASGRQTSDKQLFVPGHVLPSSPLLFSPLRAHLCYWAALLAAGCPCTLIVFSVQMRSYRGVSAECLWSACLLTQSHVVKLWHFCPLTPSTSFIGHHSSSLSHLKDWKVNIS